MTANLRARSQEHPPRRGKIAAIAASQDCARFLQSLPDRKQITTASSPPAARLKKIIAPTETMNLVVSFPTAELSLRLYICRRQRSKQVTEPAMKIAPALTVSFFALAATVFVEPASAATLSGPVSNYFEANTAVSLLASCDRYRRYGDSQSSLSSPDSAPRARQRRSQCDTVGYSFRCLKITRGSSVCYLRM